MCNICSLTKHLKDLKPLANHRHVSSPSAVLSEATRCSSVKEIVHHYILLLPVLAEIVLAKIRLFLAENCTLQELMRTLEDLDKLRKGFQDESVYHCDIRDYLDAAIRAFSALETHCSDISKLVELVEFEKAVAKIHRSQLQNEAIILFPAEH